MAPAKRTLFVGAAALALAFDQITKVWIEASLTYADRVPVIDGFFYLTRVRNPGAAFGMLATSPEPFRQIFFVVVTGIAVVLVFSFYRRLAPGDRLSGLALGLVLGGALGNLVDRVRLGEVVDFLHFRLWGGFAWPDFNIADSAIVVGVALLVLELFASEGEQRASAASSEAPPEG